MPFILGHVMQSSLFCIPQFPVTLALSYIALLVLLDITMALLAVGPETQAAASQISFLFCFQGFPGGSWQDTGTFRITQAHLCCQQHEHFLGVDYVYTWLMLCQQAVYKGNISVPQAISSVKITTTAKNDDVSNSTPCCSWTVCFLCYSTKL